MSSIKQEIKIKKSYFYLTINNNNNNNQKYNNKNIVKNNLTIKKNYFNCYSILTAKYNSQQLIFCFVKAVIFFAAICIK